MMMRACLKFTLWRKGLHAAAHCPLPGGGGGGGAVCDRLMGGSGGPRMHSNIKSTFGTQTRSPPAAVHSYRSLPPTPSKPARHEPVALLAAAHPRQSPWPAPCSPQPSALLPTKRAAPRAAPRAVDPSDQQSCIIWAQDGRRGQTSHGTRPVPLHPPGTQAECSVLLLSMKKKSPLSFCSWSFWLSCLLMRCKHTTC